MWVGPRSTLADVIRYLSDEWLAAADEVLGADASLTDTFGDASFVLEQVVTGCGEGDVIYHIRVEPGGVSVHTGPAEAPTVTFTVDHETAVGIAEGTANAQEGFTSGRLRFKGDVGILLNHHELLASLSDVLAQLRAQTDFGLA